MPPCRRRIRGYPPMWFRSGSIRALCLLFLFSRPVFGQVSFDVVSNPAPWQAAGGIATGDLNGDGKIDVVGTSLFPTQVYLGFGDGKGHFQFSSTLDYQAIKIVIADFNKDGKPDLAITTLPAGFALEQVFVLLGDGRGGFSKSWSFGFPLSSPCAQLWVQSIAVADFNGDGNLDLIVGHAGVSVFLGAGLGEFQ